MPLPFSFKQAPDGSFDCYDDLNHSNISIRGIIGLIIKNHKDRAAACTNEGQKKKLEHLAGEWERFAEVMAESKTKEEFMTNSREMFPRLIESFIVWELYK